MSIERCQFSGLFEVSCDLCGDGDDFESGDFYGCVQDMKDEGWKIRKVGNDWEHICPECNEKIKNKKPSRPTAQEDFV